MISTLHAGDAQIECYSTNDCTDTFEIRSVEGCCLNTLTGTTYSTPGGETCTRCSGMYREM